MPWRVVCAAHFCKARCGKLAQNHHEAVQGAAADQLAGHLAAHLAATAVECENWWKAEQAALQLLGKKRAPAKDRGVVVPPACTMWNKLLAPLGGTPHCGQELASLHAPQTELAGGMANMGDLVALVKEQVLEWFGEGQMKKKSRHPPEEGDCFGKGAFGLGGGLGGGGGGG